MIDGTDIRQFDPPSLRANIALAMQDCVLFSGTVRENIMLGRSEFGEDELLRASAVSGTHDFIGRTANGYDLVLADRGDGLSGGQRQSIGIARALVGSPPILVFDEPTSAMDAQTEAALIERLRIEAKGRTMLLVTHRPSLLALVDRIILLDRGKVIADGPRDRILSQITPQKAA
jgi:ATP-binding cassette subfamily C protein LapB